MGGTLLAPSGIFFKFGNKMLISLQVIANFQNFKIHYTRPLEGGEGGRISKNAERRHLENCLTKACVKYELSTMNRLVKNSIAVLPKSVD